MPNLLRKCEICRAWIDPERLTVVSDTLLCDQHARDISKFGGEFITISKEDRSSKAGSMKINIAGVTTKKVRNTEAMEKLRREFEENA